MKERNILGKKLEICSLNPLTGYNRDGKCSLDKFDHGNHLVCAKMDKNFLNFTKSRGNDLSSVVKKGQNWCLCQDRWLQAHKKGKAPKVVKKATNKETRKQVKDVILQQYGGKRNTRKKLPKLRKISYKNKKHHYRLKDPFRKRKLAIHEGVNKEAKKTGKTKKKAAIAKKGRFNILRIYRKNKKIKECNTITHDMRYMDRKYGLGKTKNICGKRGAGRKKKTRKKRGGINKLFPVHLLSVTGRFHYDSSKFISRRLNTWWASISIERQENIINGEHNHFAFEVAMDDLIALAVHEEQQQQNQQGGRKKKTRKKRGGFVDEERLNCIDIIMKNLIHPHFNMEQIGAITKLLEYVKNKDNLLPKGSVKVIDDYFNVQEDPDRFTIEGVKQIIDALKRMNQRRPTEPRRSDVLVPLVNNLTITPRGNFTHSSNSAFRGGKRKKKTRRKRGSGEQAINQERFEFIKMQAKKVLDNKEFLKELEASTNIKIKKNINEIKKKLEKTTLEEVLRFNKKIYKNQKGGNGGDDNTCALCLEDINQNNNHIPSALWPFGPYTDSQGVVHPKCSHNRSFCLNCLSKFSSFNSENQYIHVCPICRAPRIRTDIERGMTLYHNLRDSITLLDVGFLLTFVISSVMNLSDNNFTFGAFVLQGTIGLILWTIRDFNRDDRRQAQRRLNAQRRRQFPNFFDDDLLEGGERRGGRSFKKTRRKRGGGRKKRGGWEREWLKDSKGKPYYDCPGKSEGDWRYKEGIVISNVDAVISPLEAQEVKIKEMARSNGGDPILVFNHTINPQEEDRRRRADEMCLEGFRPLKVNQGKIGAGRKKKTRKKQKKQFLYNPNDPSKSFDVYIDKNPNDTIPIKYTTVKDVEDTIKKLERLYKTKKYPHKRIWQVGMIMKVRLEAMNKYKKTRYPNAKNVYKRYQLSKRYFKFLGERSKKKSFEDRKKMTFNYKMPRRKTRKKQKGGYRMKEKIMKFKKGPFPKKYTAIVKDIKSKKTRKIHFGDRRYQQYKDRTPLKLYAKNNHNTRKRMQNYFNRHSGTKKRSKAIKKEKIKSRGKYNAKILSHIFLW